MAATRSPSDGQYRGHDGGRIHHGYALVNMFKALLTASS